MLLNSYGNLIEPWKVELIVKRAVKMGFRDDELEDAQQELILAVLKFRYDPARSNGATEATALTTLIDRRLRNIWRSEERYRLRQQRGPLQGRQLDNGEDSLRAIEVRTAVEALPAKERQVCLALSEGRSKHEIARQLGCGWHTVDRVMGRVRTHLRNIGETS